RLNNLIFDQLNNSKLFQALEFIKPQLTTESLAANDEFDFADLYQFIQTSHKSTDTITGSEFFLRKILNPKKNVSIPDDIYKLLTEYYKKAYGEK
ncbi:28640_t:CDS:1, partial [Racocetra persica]